MRGYCNFAKSYYSAAIAATGSTVRCYFMQQPIRMCATTAVGTGILVQARIPVQRRSWRGSSRAE
jgi:hypothetical protein